MPHYRNLKTGRFVKRSNYNRSVRRGKGENFRVELGPREIERLIETPPGAEPPKFGFFGLPKYDYMDVYYEAPEEDEY